MKKTLIIIVVVVVVAAASIYYFTQTKSGLINRFILKWAGNSTAAQRAGIRQEMEGMTLDQIREYIKTGPG